MLPQTYSLGVWEGKANLGYAVGNSLVNSKNKHIALSFQSLSDFESGLKYVTDIVKVREKSNFFLTSKVLLCWFINPSICPSIWFSRYVL